MPICVKIQNNMGQAYIVEVSRMHGMADLKFRRMVPLSGREEKESEAVYK